MASDRRAGYHVAVAGNAEALARVALATMQERLSKGPNTALGLGIDPSGEEVRAAFLQLTKQYHPARFARMANDIQRLSNEVFLALRAAHDHLAKASMRQTASFGVVRPASQPPVSATAPLPRVGPQPVRPARMPLANDSSQTLRTSPTPATGVKVVQGGRPPAQPVSPHPRGAVGSGPLRQSGGHPAVAATDLQPVLELLQRQQFDQARTAIHQLTARDPSSKKIKALMCYARGREAQLERRLDDARVELQEALDLDPDLQLAKTALTELFTRRK